MKDKVFEHQIRVPYAHTDQMGFVYYANYLVYFEMARSHFLREVGLPYSEMEKNGVILPVVVAKCEYRKPAHFDDLLIVYSRCSVKKGARLRVDYEIKRDGELIVTGYTEHVCMSAERKVMRLVPELRKLIQQRECDNNE